METCSSQIRRNILIRIVHLLVLRYCNRSSCVSWFKCRYIFPFLQSLTFFSDCVLSIYKWWNDVICWNVSLAPLSSVTPFLAWFSLVLRCFNKEKSSWGGGARPSVSLSVYDLAWATKHLSDYFKRLCRRSLPKDCWGRVSFVNIDCDNQTSLKSLNEFLPCLPFFLNRFRLN